MTDYAAIYNKPIRGAMERLSIRVRGRDCASVFSACLAASFKKTLAYETSLPEHVLSMQGPSGVSARILLNNFLATIPFARYLEIGSWPGSTACAALSGNVVTVVCVDDWSSPGSSAAVLTDNLARVKSPYNSFDICSCDFRTMDFTGIGWFNVYLFAGQHDRISQTDGVHLPMACLDDEFIFVAEEWNDAVVRAATADALRRASLSCLYGLEIRTTTDDGPARVSGPGSDWHNGYFVGVFTKGPR